MVVVGCPIEKASFAVVGLGEKERRGGRRRIGVSRIGGLNTVIIPTKTNHAFLKILHRGQILVGRAGAG